MGGQGSCPAARRGGPHPASLCAWVLEGAPADIAASARAQGLVDVARSPQFQQQVETFSHALQTGQLDLAQFGLEAQVRRHHRRSGPAAWDTHRAACSHAQRSLIKQHRLLVQHNSSYPPVLVAWLVVGSGASLACGGLRGDEVGDCATCP